MFTTNFFQPLVSEKDKNALFTARYTSHYDPIYLSTDPNRLVQLKAGSKQEEPFIMESRFLCWYTPN